jgi:hypothetical protein
MLFRCRDLILSLWRHLQVLDQSQRLRSRGFRVRRYGRLLLIVGGKSHPGQQLRHTTPDKLTRQRRHGVLASQAKTRQRETRDNTQPYQQDHYRGA